MGVPGLWKVLKPAVHIRTFTQVATTEGFESGRRESRTLFIGVDASILINRAQYAAYHQKGGLNMQAGENLPLQILFWQACRMLALAVTPIYVFEGDKGPSFKRGREVKTTPHALTDSFQELLTSFGFHFYTAPGEAEAELAELSKLGKVDAVMTDDVDALVFGATHVIQIPNKSKDGDLVSIYTSESIQSSVALSAPQMILIAILSGGDYNKDGLSGCGIDTALKLSQHTSLATELYEAACRLSDTELKAYLIDWRVRLRNHLLSDPGNILNRKFPSAAKNVKHGFPAIPILRNYVQPLTSSSDGCELPNTSQWGCLQPNLESIAVWCEKYFSWGKHDQLVSRFRDNVWRGICARSLIKPADLTIALLEHTSNWVKSGDFNHSNIISILKAKLGPGPSREHGNVPGYTINVETHTLMASMFRRLPADISRPQDRNMAIIWVPASILRGALPALVDLFHRHGTSNARQKKATSDLELLFARVTTPAPPARHDHLNPRSLLDILNEFHASIQVHNCDREVERRVAEDSARSAANRRGVRFLGFFDLTDK